MKKRLCSLLLAVLMLLSMLPMGVSAAAITGNTAVPTEPELRMHVRQWPDSVETEYVTTSFSYPLNDWWDARFFMYYPDGSTKQIDPYAMGRTSEIDLIGVDDAGWAEHKAAHIGPGLIEYTESNAYTGGEEVTYRVSVEVHLPDLGLYNDARTFGESTLVDELMVSEVGDVYYIALSPEKIGEGLRMAQINTVFDSEVKHPSITEVANVTLSADGTYAKIVFTTIEVEDHYHFEAQITDVVNNYSGTWGRTVPVGRDLPGLYHCNVAWDEDEQVYYIDHRYPESEWYTIPGNTRWSAFFFGRPSDIQAGKVKPLSEDDLYFYDGLEVEPWDGDRAEQMPENALRIRCTDFNAKGIRYSTADGDYFIYADPQLPEIGFYTTDSATQSGFLFYGNPFTVTETARTFYVCPADADEMSIQSVNGWLDGGEKYFDTTVASDGRSVKITVKDSVAVPNDSFELEVVYTDERGRTQQDGIRVWIESDLPGLYFCYGERDDATESWFINYDQIDSEWHSVPGYSKAGSFFFGRPADIQAGKVQPLALGDLTFRGDLDADDLEDNYTPTKNLLTVDCTGFSAKYIRYIENGVSYDMPVVLHLPGVGFYSSNAADEDTFIYRQNPFTVTEKDRTVYLCADYERSGKPVRLVDLQWHDSEADRVFDWTLVSDRTYIEVWARDGVIVPNETFHAEITIEEWNGSTWETVRNGAALTVENGMPALMFRHLEWDDEEQEWVENHKRELETVVDFDLGEEFPVQFYYGTEDEYIKVDPSELTLPEDVLSGFMREGVYWLRGDGFWTEGEIEYINPNGETVKMMAYSEQPSFAFYSSTQASKETWLNREEITMYTDTPVYVIPRSGRTITGVEYIRNTRTGADVTDQFIIEPATDGSYIAIKLNPKNLPDGNTRHEIRVNDLNGWWRSSFRLYRGDLPQLTTPTDLVWHTEYEYWRENGVWTLHTEERMGSMGFEMHNLCQNHAEIEVYSAADGYQNPVLTGGWGFGDLEEKTHFSVTDFIYADLPSGTYKFRVRNEGDGTKYRSSEWSAMSDAFVYTQPTQRLEAPDSDEFYWEKADGRYFSVWQSTGEDAAGYFEICWYYRNEDGKIVSAHSGCFDIPVEENCTLYRSDIYDETLNRYGDTEYYFHVRAIPKDITQYRISKWSGYSPALAVNMITDNVNGKLDNLIPDTSAGESTSVQDVQNALQSETADLRAAMDADLNGDSGTLDRIAELEKLVSDNVDQKIDAKNSAPQAIQDIASGVTMIGATLNLADKNPETGKTPTVTLELDAPKQGIVIDEQQHNAVQFSMKLNGAVNHDDVSDAQQQLIVPVVIDMPVPTGINPDFLVVLHKLMDGSIEQLRPYIYWDTQKVCHARFVVDSFSDFALLEYDFRFEKDESTVQVGDEDICIAAINAALGAVVTYESSNPKIAEVDEETGVVEINRVGEVTITATASATEVYPEATAEYTLIIKEQTAVAPEYTVTLGEIVLLDPLTNEVQNGIPTGTAKVRVYVYDLPSDAGSVVMLGGYDEDGRMVQMEVMGGRTTYPDGTCYYEEEKVNISSEVHSLKAMIVDAFGTFVPISDSPAERSNDGITNRPVLPIVPTMEIVSGGSTATMIIDGDFDPHAAGSYIDVSMWDPYGEIYMGTATYAGINTEGKHTYTFENPNAAYGDFYFRLYANGYFITSNGCYLEGNMQIDPIDPVTPEMTISPKGSKAAITVTGAMDTEDYIAVYAQQNGTFTYVGTATWDVQGDNVHSFSFENPYDDDCTFLFQLWIDNATAAEQTVSLAASAVSTVPKFENITVDGSKATITVVGDMDVNNDSIRAYTWDGFKYSFLGFAELESSENNVHTYTFANATGKDCDIQFRLTIGGAEADTWTVYVPAAGETVPQQVEAPKGILSMAQTGMSLKIGMDVPDSMDNIDYFKLGFYDSSDREGTLQTGITCSLDHPYFYAPMDKFVVGTSYNKVEITAVGKDGYADATWTGDVSMVRLNPGFSATYTYDVGGDNRLPLLSVDLEYSAPGFYHIGVYENGKLIANDEAYQSLESGKVLARSTTAEEDAAIRNGNAEVKLRGWNIAQLYEADGIWHMQMSIYSDTTAECMGIITPEDPDTPEETETALLPSDIHLEYAKNSGLMMVMTPPADTSLIDGNILWSYNVNKGLYSTTRELRPTVQATALLTTYDVLKEGENTIDITLSANPTAAAMEAGYTAESSAFNATIQYTEETSTYNTTNVKATLEDTDIANQKTLTVTGLKPNQSYLVSVWDSNGVINNNRELTTDANGTGTSTWYVYHDFTYCTIAEWEISDVTDTSANIVRRDYNGQFSFGEAAPVSENVWFTENYGNYYLNWTPVTLNSGEYYFVNGENTYNKTGSQYSISSLLSGLTESTDITIGVGSYSAGQTKVLYTLKNALTVENLDAVSLKLNPITEGSNAGKYQLEPSNPAAFDTTGTTYYLTMMNADGEVVMRETSNSTGCYAVAPWEGCIAEGHLARITKGSTVVENDVSKILGLNMQLTPAVDVEIVLAASSTDVTEVATLSALETALRMGGTVRLTADLSGQTINADSGAPATLDLNGHALTVNYFYIKNGKELTLTGGENGDGVLNVSNGQLQYGSSLTLRDLTYNGQLSSAAANAPYAQSRLFSMENVTWVDDGSYNTYASTILLQGTTVVEVKNCDVTGYAYDALEVRSAESVTVTGGSFACNSVSSSAGTAAAIGLYMCDHVTLTGVTGTSTKCGIRANSCGTVEINNCDLTSGADGFNGALYLQDFESLQLNGGTYTASSTSGYVLYTVNSNAGSEIVITDGSFLQPVKSYNTFNVNPDKIALTISGGTFTTDPSAYLAEGVEVTEQNGLWTVTSIAEEPASHTMEVTAEGNRAIISVTGDLSIDDYVMVHALINGEYEEIGWATPEVFGDGITTFSFMNFFTDDCEYLFQLWIGGEVVTYKKTTLAGTPYTIEVVTDGSNATVTLNGQLNENNNNEVVIWGIIDGAETMIGPADPINSFADLHTFTFMNPNHFGYKCFVSLTVNSTEVFRTNADYYIEGCA